MKRLRIIIQLADGTVRNFECDGPDLIIRHLMLSIGENSFILADVKKIIIEPID